MNMPLAPPFLDPDDLLEMPNGKHYELVDGVPMEKAVGAESSEIGATVLALLIGYIRPRRLGRVYDGQTGFRCFPGRPRLVRKPDAAFVAEGRLPNGKSPKGDFLIAPDLAAEVVSPNDTYESVEGKVAEYRSAGVKLVWVISPGSRTVIVRRLDGTCTEVGEAGELSGEDVVPGFTCKVAELFS